MNFVIWDKSQLYCPCSHGVPVATPGPRFNIKMTSYQYRKSHCGDKTILRPSYLHNGISYTGKMTSLYWIRAQEGGINCIHNVSFHRQQYTFMSHLYVLGCVSLWNRATGVAMNKILYQTGDIFLFFNSPIHQMIFLGHKFSNPQKQAM